jgi:hypothetical protein
MKIGDLVSMAREKAQIRKRLTGLVEAEYQKRKQYQALVGTELNYPIIQDLINSAAQGVEVVISLPGGTTMKMARTASVDPRQRLDEYKDLY